MASIVLSLSVCSYIVVIAHEICFSWTEDGKLQVSRHTYLRLYSRKLLGTNFYGYV